MHKAEIVGDEELLVCSPTMAKFQVFKFIPARFDSNAPMRAFDIAQRTSSCRRNARPTDDRWQALALILRLDEPFSLKPNAGVIRWV
jgi:hypothetical protein